MRAARPAPTPPGAVVKVTGSYGETPTSCDCRMRFTASDTASPKINPNATGRQIHRTVQRRRERNQVSTTYV
jgi:hypothetical protein